MSSYVRFFIKHLQAVNNQNSQTHLRLLNLTMKDTSVNTILNCKSKNCSFYKIVLESATTHNPRLLESEYNL